MFQCSGWSGYVNKRKNRVKDEKIARNKEGCFRMIKRSVHQEDKIIYTYMHLTSKPENTGNKK